jgi:transketolase
VKGKGVSFMEGQAGWHGKAPTPEETATALARVVRCDGKVRVMSRATREAYGATLVELADEGVDVVVVEADLSKSTTTSKLLVMRIPSASSTSASPSRT